MTKFTHIPQFADFRGIDLRSSDVLRERGFASDGTKNVMHTPQGGIMTRHGMRTIGKTYGCLGIFAFKQTDILGNEVTEIIGFGADSAANSVRPYRLVESSFTLTNSHATDAATVSHFADSSDGDSRFRISRGGGTLYNGNIGSGLGGSPTMLSTLETAVDALTSFSMSTPTNASTTPAAFIQLMNEETVAANGGTLTVKYWYWEETTFDSSVQVGIPHYAYEVGLDSFQNVSAVVLRGCLYVSWGAVTGKSINGNSASGRATIWKYDGQKFYRPGLPGGGAKANGGSGVSSNATGNYDTNKGTINFGSTLASGHKWKSRLVFVDKAGNRVEGDFNDESDRTTGAAAVWGFDIGVVNASLTQSNRGFARVNGAYTGLSPTVDAGVSLNPGDIAFFYDNGQGRCIQREVTAASGTSMTVSATPIDQDVGSPTYDDGSTPQFLDNALISANMRCEIWRTKADGEEFYFRDVIPIGVAPTYTTYYDAGADTNLLDALIEPVVARSWRRSGSATLYNAPAGRYLATFNDQLLVAGNDQKPCTVFFSDIESPEYFPQGINEFDIDEPVTGLGQCGEVLLVFSKTKTHAITGDLANYNFRKDVIADGIGCTAHASIQKLDEGVLVWQSARGPYVSFGGRRVEPLGAKTYADNTKVSRLEPFFTRVYSTGQDGPNFKRATSAVLPKERLYLLYVPYEDPDFPSYETSSGVLFVYDYGRDAWWKWDGWKCAGGMAVLDDELYFAERSHDGAGTAYTDAVARLHKRQTALARTNASDTGKYNFADHNTGITAVYRSHWESLGRPSELKRGLRCRLSSHETRVATSTEMTLKTYVDYDTSLTSNNDTLTWTTQKDLKPKIKGEVCRSMMFEFGQSAKFHQPMLISGYEPEFTAGFRPGAGFKE